MAYVVAATYRCKEGEEDRILEILETMAPLSRLGARLSLLPGASLA